MFSFMFRLYQYIFCQTKIVNIHSIKRFHVSINFTKTVRFSLYFQINIIIIIIINYYSIITGVIPYLPYSKQCIMKRRGCITAKLLASMLSRAGTLINMSVVSFPGTHTRMFGSGMETTSHAVHYPIN